MTTSLPQRLNELNSGRVSAGQLTEIALERATTADGEGARVFTRIYDASARCCERLRYATQGWPEALAD